MAQPLSEIDLLTLLDALADGHWHSGEDLAAQGGVTRAALAKRIEKLREWQIHIEARHGLGYRLPVPLERLDAATLQKALPRPIKLEVLAATDSTNSRLLDASSSDDPQFLLAEFQTNGRGRRGRRWASPFGSNIYLSLAWSFQQWPPQLSALPLAIGVACARVLRKLGAEAGIKWPNDLWIDNRKLGGILIEHRGETGGPCRVVIGIGINVAMSKLSAGSINQPWIALNEVMAEPVSRNLLAQELICALLEALSGFSSRGLEPFLLDWNQFDLTAGRSVMVESSTPLEGIARGINESGALIVEAKGRRHIINSGEVSLRLS